MYFSAMRNSGATVSSTQQLSNARVRKHAHVDAVMLLRSLWQRSQSCVLLQEARLRK
jgi:hypothetical protein